MQSILNVNGNLNTKVSKSNFENTKEQVKSQLHNGEKIELYIKGANIDMLKLGVGLSAASMSASFGKSNDIGFNYSIFITNERVFILDTTYTNETLNHGNNFRVYNRDEILSVKFNSEKLPKVKRTFGEKLRRLVDTLISSYIYVSGSILAFFGINGMLQQAINGKMEMYKLDPVASTLAFSIMAVFAGILVYKTQFKSRVKIVTKNNEIFDMIVVNSDVKTVESYLKSF